MTENECSFDSRLLILKITQEVWQKQRQFFQKFSKYAGGAKPFIIIQQF
jgi:hypothetical protein